MQEERTGLPKGAEALKFRGLGFRVTVMDKFPSKEHDKFVQVSVELGNLPGLAGYM